MQDLHTNPSPLTFRLVAFGALTLLFTKLLLSTLYEYRWYFPADFDSPFLTGRQMVFHGIYRTSFYAHIIAGPIAVILGACLILSGGRRRVVQFHRYIGRLQIGIVVLILAPSGLVMANWAHAGPIAGIGFALLSLATAATAIAAVVQARARNFRSHRNWANRCFILLCSPLLLRFISGVLTVMHWDSAWTYQLNAWVSWLAPLAGYEWWSRFKVTHSHPVALARQPRTT